MSNRADVCRSKTKLRKKCMPYYGNEQVDRYLDKTTVIKMAQHESPRQRHRWCIDLVLVNEAICVGGYTLETEM